MSQQYPNPNQPGWSGQQPGQYPQQPGQQGYQNQGYGMGGPGGPGGYGQLPPGPKKSKTGLIVGLVIGLVVVLIAVGVLLFFLLKDDDDSSDNSDGENTSQTTDDSDTDDSDTDTDESDDPETDGGEASNTPEELLDETVAAFESLDLPAVCELYTESEQASIAESWTSSWPSEHQASSCAELESSWSQIEDQVAGAMSMTVSYSDVEIDGDTATAQMEMEMTNNGQTTPTSGGQQMVIEDGEWRLTGGQGASIF